MDGQPVDCHTTRTRRELLTLLFSHEIKKLVPDYKRDLKRREITEEVMKTWDGRTFNRIVDMLRKRA